MFLLYNRNENFDEKLFFQDIFDEILPTLVTVHRYLADFFNV
jgi:hypothetical protein